MFPLFGKDFSWTQLIEHVLEGSTSDLPIPSVAALQKVLKKLTELELSTLCKRAKQEAKVGSACGHGHGDSFLCARGGRRGRGRFSTQFTDNSQAPPST